MDPSEINVNIHIDPSTEQTRRAIVRARNLVNAMFDTPTAVHALTLNATLDEITAAATIDDPTGRRLDVNEVVNDLAQLVAAVAGIAHVAIICWRNALIAAAPDDEARTLAELLAEIAAAADRLGGM